MARTIAFAGSVKWLQSPFDGRDLAALERAAPAVPGFDPDTGGLAVVSRSGLGPNVDRERVALSWDAMDLLDVWRV